jgi:hypothetical protein
MCYPAASSDQSGAGSLLGISDMDEIVFREVDRETWSDFVSLFESRGGPKKLLVYGLAINCR